MSPESQKARTIRTRDQARLSSKLEKNLWTYAAAASAAGVGLLAAPPSADAKIVYTPVNAKVQDTGYTLDLNHDGIADFYLVNGGGASIGGSLEFSYLAVCHIPQNDASHQCVESASSIQPNKDNTVRIASSGAAALPAGAKIGFGEKFQLPGFAAGLVGREFYSNSKTEQFWKGPWANGGKGTTNRYLGFKFKINGEFHYGWARLTVTTPAHGGYGATLTGYAYETVANRGIVAGQTSETEDASDMQQTGPAAPADVPMHDAYQPATLGLLGLGVAGMSIWRRNEDLLE